MTTHTLTLQRVLRTPPEKVYRAFLDAQALTKWLPPFGFTANVEQLDARVGGSYRMAFTNLTSGQRHAFHGEYLELVPHSRIRYTDQFDDPSLPGTLQTTVCLTAVFCGTELQILQKGIPAAIPLQACLLGWQESLIQLAQLVEPDITD